MTVCKRMVIEHTKVHGLLTLFVRQTNKGNQNLSETLHMTSKGLVEMLEGDVANTLIGG